MQFENPQNLLWMLIVPVVFAVIVAGYAVGKGRMQKFAEPGTWDFIRPYFSVRRGAIRSALLLAGMALAAFSVAGPKFGAAFEQVQSQGLDVVLAIDTSDSMLARDFKPDRLTFAKREVDHLLKRLRGDRVALLPFSGQAYLLCPLTLDHSAIRMFLGVVDIDTIPTQGTDLSTAIDAARTVFDKTERKYRVMILLTDGEDLMGKGAEAAKRAMEDDIVIFVLGIGTDKGVPIPVKDSQGNTVYKKDQKGELVMSKVDRATLSNVAKTTGGIFVHATYDESAQDAIFARIDKMERKKLEGRLISRLKARFQWFLVPGLVLIVIGIGIPKRKSTFNNRKG